MTIPKHTMKFFSKKKIVILLQTKHYIFLEQKVIFVTISKTVTDIKKVGPMSNIYFLFCSRLWYLKFDQTYNLEKMEGVKFDLNELL